MKNIKFKVIYTLCLLATIVMSCNKDDFSQPESSMELYDASVSTTIPIEEALSSLDQLMGELYGKTRSSASSYTVDVFGGIKTKSGEVELPDTSLYIVNFGDKEGYAVLSAQSKVQTKVFCITESGFIAPEDIRNAIIKMSDSTVTTKGGDVEDEEYFAEYGRGFVPAIIASSLLNQLLYDYEIEDDDCETKANMYVGTPNTSAMLETKWTQSSPFNDFRSDGAPAGCVAIATAQIIEFNALKHDYDSFVEDKYKTFDWNLLSKVCHYSNLYNNKVDSAALKEASDFLYYIGLKKNCNIKYGADGSSGWADGAKRTFNNMGYKSVKKYLGFEKADKNRAISQLTSGFPMYMDGSGPDGGHAFVLDGLYTRKVYGENGDYMRTENMFHINWGWRGQDDGYYSQGVFDTSKRVDTESGIDPGSVSQPYSKYTWNYRTITYSL